MTPVISRPPLNLGLLDRVARSTGSAGMCFVGPDLVMSWANPTLGALLGVPSESLAGRPLLEFVDPERCPELWQVAQRRPGCTGVSCLATLPRAGRDPAHVRLWAEILEDGNGDDLGMLLTVFDRSDRESRRQIREHSLRLFEELFGALTHASPEGMVVVDDEGAIVFWNPAAERLFGWSRAEALGQPVHKLLAPDRYRERIRLGVSRFRVSGDGPAINNTLEMEARHRSGREVPVELTISTVRIEERWHAVANIRDISDRKLAEKRLRDAAHQLRTLLDSLHTGVVAWDTETGLIIAVNPEAARLLGAPRERLLGSRFDDAIRTVGEAAESCRLADTEGRNVECSLERLDGARFDALIRATPTTLDDRPCSVVSFVDITARAAAEAEQRRAAAEAERAARTKSEFLANMSHEIRTPLNAVLGLATLLDESGLDPEQRGLLTTLRESGESLLEIVDAVLDFSRLESGRLELEATPFDLAEIAEEVGQMLAPRAEERGLELTCFVDPAVPRLLVGDPTRLRQVLVNLVGNAVKFTECGAVDLRIAAVGGSATRRSLRVVVSDTGVGIPADRLAAIFESFTQADGSTTRRHGGSGLGLTISRRLVEAMGGTLEVASQVGKGSVFSFTINLPLAAMRSPSPGRARRESLDGVRVLVVDDSPVNRMIVRRTLEPAGCRCEEAENGEDGLISLRRAVADGRPFDVAVLDHHMPRVDGAQLARLVHGDPTLAGLRVLLLSSAASRRREAGVDVDTCHGMLSKPVRQSRLVEAVAAVLGRTPSTPATFRADRPRPSATGGDRRLRVLLAEDNATNRLVARRFLERLGADTVTAENGREAVDRWRSGSFDLVLMDVQMPELDGIEATRAIRNAEIGGARVPIVAMTAHALPGDRERCLEAGMDDYLSKPIDATMLREALERWRPDRSSAAPVEAAEPPSAAGVGAASTTLDREHLVQATGGDESFAGHLLQLYLREADHLVATIRAASVGDDLEPVRIAAHSLRGSSATVGAFALAEAAGSVEHAVRTDDRSKLASSVGELVAVADVLHAAVQSRLAAAS